MEQIKNMQDLIDNTEILYQLGLHWLRANRQELAERWLRYAAIRGHELADSTLKAATKIGIAKDIKQRINYLAIEILESLITPEPTEEQIAKVEKIIADNINLNNFFSLH